MRAARLPSSHPEGFIEAFGNIYRDVARAIRHRLDGQTPLPPQVDFPTVHDGVRGMAFIETVIASNKTAKKWTLFTL